MGKARWGACSLDPGPRGTGRPGAGTGRGFSRGGPGTDPAASERPGHSCPRPRESRRCARRAHQELSSSPGDAGTVPPPSLGLMEAPGTPPGAQVPGASVGPARWPGDSVVGHGASSHPCTLPASVLRPQKGKCPRSLRPAPWRGSVGGRGHVWGIGVAGCPPSQLPPSAFPRPGFADLPSSPGPALAPASGHWVLGPGGGGGEKPTHRL